MKPITLIVLTRDEELHIERCLKSAEGLVSQMIVVDSGSTDKTVSIAESLGAKVYTHPFVNQAEQFNWALENAEISGEWILRLDADEYLLPELREEIARAVESAPDSVGGFYMKRRVHFMKRWIRHGGYYPRWFLRVWRKGQAKSEPREMDEHIVLVKGGARRLANDFVDENLRDLHYWTAKHNDFSSREVQSILRGDSGAVAHGFDKSRTVKKGFYMRLPLFLRAAAYFKWRYFIRLGFLDGIPGLVFHLLQGFWYRFLIDAKVYEAKRK
jgi:glycosyltransferase involved in cell wall biosynthesis